MKILILNKHVQDSIGGSEIQCDLIAMNLKKFGHDVTYGIIHPKKNRYELGYDVAVLKKNYFTSLYRTLKKVRPEIVYWRHNKNYLLLTALFVRLFRAKFIFAVSSLSDTKRWRRSGIIPLGSDEKFKKNFFSPKELAKLLISVKNSVKSFVNFFGFHFVDGVVALNADYVHKTPPKKQITIHNSMLLNHIPFAWDKPFIVWVSNLKPVKHPEKYVELSAHFVDTGVDFLMVGAQRRKQYEFVRDREKLPPNLRFLGPKPVEEVNGILRASLFMVHTCDPEGFGNNFIQAWLNAKPTVSLFFDPESMIRNNKIGFFSGSMEQMVRDVKNLIENEPLRLQMGRKAEKFARENFDPEKNARRLEKFLREFQKK